MAIKEGDDLFYITGTGAIHPAKATANERNGSVAIVYGDNIRTEMGALHLCRTMRAAEIVAHRRKPK